MSLTPFMIVLLFSASLIFALIVVLFTLYIKQQIDAAKLKKVLLQKEESILKQQNIKESKKSSTFFSKN